MSQESVFEIERLYTYTMQAYQSLDTLQRPIHHWDDFLIFLTTQKLDPIKFSLITVQSIKTYRIHLNDPGIKRKLDRRLLNHCHYLINNVKITLYLQRHETQLVDTSLSYRLNYQAINWETLNFHRCEC